MSSSPDLRVFFLMIPPRGQYPFSYSLLFFFAGATVKLLHIYQKYMSLKLKKCVNLVGSRFYSFTFLFALPKPLELSPDIKGAFLFTVRTEKRLTFVQKKILSRHSLRHRDLEDTHNFIEMLGERGSVRVCVVKGGGGGVSFALYVKSKALQCNVSTGSRCRIHYIKPCWLCTVLVSSPSLAAPPAPSLLKCHFISVYRGFREWHQNISPSLPESGGRADNRPRGDFRPTWHLPGWGSHVCGWHWATTDKVHPKYAEVANAERDWFTEAGVIFSTENFIQR